MKTKRSLIQIFLLGAALIAALTTEAQPTVTQIACGTSHNLFLKSDGSLWGMGYYTQGELGDGSGAFHFPSDTPWINYIPAEILYMFSGASFVSSDGIDHPEQIVAGGVTAIAAGTHFSLFLENGSLWGMGANNLGQLGDGTTNANVTVPEHIILPGVGGSILAIAAGGSHSLYIKQHGNTVELWAMGDNTYGQLGDGTTINRSTPVKILSTDITHGSPVTAIATGPYHSLFLKADGSLWAMGRNDRGQLGDASTTDRHAPVEIESSGVTAIAAAYKNSMFITSSGQLYSMGDNSSGQFGDNSIDSGPIPNPQLCIASGVITAIACGSSYGLFLKNDGSLWGIGNGGAGVLGDGTSTIHIMPVQIVASGVTAIATGGENETSLFIRSDGSLWGMGFGFFGELGDYAQQLASLLTSVNVPEQIVTPPPPTLGITTYGNQTVVFFPLSVASNYVLQIKSSLTDSNWMTCTGQVPVIGLMITNVPGAFLRLH